MLIYKVTQDGAQMVYFESKKQILNNPDDYTNYHAFSFVVSE